jgi:mono/diheme cytochrome c family protein
MKNVRGNAVFALVITILGISLSVLFSQTQPQSGWPQPSYQLNYIPTNVLAFDAEAKEYNAKPGELDIPFSFYVTNVSTNEVVINSVHTSCGCTVAQLPSLPWKIAPGEHGEIKVKMDVRGKTGQVTKTISLTSSHGMKILAATARVPFPDMTTTTPEERQRNQLIARANRQAVFRGDCARCHATPAIGKMGAELYKATCAVCHDAEHRATMVPDLRNPPRPNTREYWAQIIMFGKPDTLMPAHAKANGGILDDEQIFSLVEYMVGDFRKTVTPSANPTVNPR